MIPFCHNWNDLDELRPKFPFKVYSDAIVYIRKLIGNQKPPEEDPTDPDFSELADGSIQPKRFKLNGNSDFVRRSNRRQKVRGEKEIKVRSDMLLRDLKVQVSGFESCLFLNSA